MKKLLAGLIIMTAAGYGLLNYHFVLLDDNFKILKKVDVRYENTFVDARGIKKLELAFKPDLLAAGINDVLRQVDETIQGNSPQ